MAEKKKILLIDDDETSLELTANMLKKEYEIAIARSGQEALNYLIQQSIPDLLLLDILMPEMDGWETYKKIKGISLLKDVPIAFLTAIEETTEENRAYQMGIDDYIRKPYTQKELFDRVAALLEKNKK